MWTPRRFAQSLALAAFLTALAACAGDADTPAPGKSAQSENPFPAGPIVGKAGTGAPGPSYVWTDRSEVFVPRMLPASVDQPGRNRLLVYGGWQENGVRFDTWEWDGLGWIRRRPLHDPGNRVAATMTYDELRHRVILIGGATDFMPSFTFDKSTSTWEWDGDDWTQLSVLHSPPPSTAATSTWDPERNLVLMFGGFSPPVDDGAGGTTSPGSDQLWAFDGFDWRQIPRTEPWPPPSGLASMVWDRARKRAVLLSGFKELNFSASGTNFGLTADGAANFSPIGDTWEWDGSVWTQTGTREAQGLVTAGGSLVYDEVKQSVGMQLTELALVARELKQSYRDYGDGSVWNLVAYAPSTQLRILLNTRWSSANRAPFVFGGVKLDPETYRLLTESALDEAVVGTPWLTEPTPVQMPAVHHASSVAENDGSATLFGGIVGTAFSNDMYGWNGGKWVYLAPIGQAPSPRAHAAMTRFGDVSVLFGGQDESGDLDDTWTWNAASSVWAQAMGANGVAARRDATMFQVGDSAYLFGGTYGMDNRYQDTWRFRSGGWSAVGATEHPGNRRAPCGASLAGKASAMFAGGDSDGDVWSFDGDWNESLEESGLGLREGCHMAYASSFQQMLLVGGRGAPGTQDVWSIWPSVSPVLTARASEARSELPPRRSGAVLVDNPRSGGLMMFGGVRNDTASELADTWQLKMLGQACTEGAACGNGAFCTDGVCCEVATCGPCGTCALGGTCTPRAAGPTAGCDGNAACNDEGHCRLGTGQVCASNAACAAGGCIKSGDAGEAGVCCGTEGCAIACVGDQLRNAEGALTDCAPYGCEGDRCKNACSSVADCTGGTVCDQFNKCVSADSAAGDDTSSCGCKVAGVSAASSWLPWAGLALAGAALARRRRRS